MCAPCATCEVEKGRSASPNTPKTSPDTMPAAAPVDPCQPNKCACHATSPWILQKSTAPQPAQGLDPQRAQSGRSLLRQVPAARPCKLRTSLRRKRKQELEQRSITACLGTQHADSHSTALCRRPHQRTHGSRVMMGLPGSLTHRALSSDVVACRKRAALLGTFSVSVPASSAILIPPVHPTPLYRQLAR